MYKLSFTERKGAKETCTKVLETMGIKFDSKDLERFDILDLDLTDIAFQFLAVISKNHPEMGFEEKNIHALWAVQGFLHLLTEDMNNGEVYEPAFNPSHLFFNWVRISEQKSTGSPGSSDDKSSDPGGSDDRKGATILGFTGTRH